MSGKNQGIFRWMISGNPEFAKILDPDEAAHNELPHQIYICTLLVLLYWNSM